MAISPTLNIPQARFLAMPHKFKAYVAGFGSGKTWVGCGGICKGMWEHPKINQGYFAPTYPQIRDIFYPTIEEVAFDWGLTVKINEGNKEVHFYEGRRYRGTTICRSMEKPGSIVGFKIGNAMVDELDVMAAAKARQAWRKIIARMRYKVDGLRNGIDVTTTPEGFKFVYHTTEEAFKRRGRSVNEFSEVVGVDVADAALEGYVKYGLKALTAAIGANTDMVVTADIETDGKKTLTRGLRKYGDKFNRVALFVMHSATYFDIVDEAIANKIHEEAGVVVYGGQPGTLGKPVLVTDSMNADAILGLVQGAVYVTESQAPGFRSYDINDQENLAVGFRAEGTVNVELLGYSWDESKGDKNPSLEKIGTEGNWKKHFTSNKSTAGVLIKLTGTETVDQPVK